MRLREVRIRNFGPIEQATFTPAAPLVLLYGENGAAKSTICDAARWMLTNRATGVPDRGEGQRALIRLGQIEMEVEGEWETSAGVLTMRRALGLKGVVSKGIPEQDKVLKDAAAVFCHGEAFLEEEPERQRAVFLAAVDPRVSLARVADAVPMDETPMELGMWPPALGEDPATIMLRRGDVARLFSWADEVRKQIGRDMKAIPAAVDWTKVDGGQPDVAKLEAAIETLRKDERAMAQAAGESIGRKKLAQEQLRRVLKRQKDLDERGRRFRFTDQKEYTAAIAQAERNLGNEDRAYAEWQEGKTAIEEERRRLEDELRQLNAGYDGLYSLGEACVIHAAIACPLPKQQRTGVLMKMSERRDEIEAALAKLVVRPAPPNPATTRQSLDDLRREYKEAGGHAEQGRGIGQEIQELVRQGASIADEMPGDKAPAADPGVPAELQALRDRIQRGEDTVRRARELLDQDAKHEAAVRTQEGAQRRLERYQKACKFLGAGGVIDVALGEGLKTVLTGANRFLAPWGWTITLNLDPFMLALGDGRPIGRLSKAERWWVGAALAMAAAIAAGWKTVFLDGADQLARENRGRLTQMVQSAAEAGLMVIITAVPSQPIPATAPPGMEIWVVESGHLAKVA